MSATARRLIETRNFDALDWDPCRERGEALVESLVESREVTMRFPNSDHQATSTLGSSNQTRMPFLVISLGQRRVALWLVFFCASPVLVKAQGSPEYRSIASPDAHSRMFFSSVSVVRSLNNGNLLVHDIKARKLVLLDSSLDSLVVVADASGSTNALYGSEIGALIAWRGDSSAFIDPESASMLLIDDHGRVRRVAALPSALGLRCLIGGPAGTPALDAHGRLLCRMPPAIRRGTDKGSLPIAVPVVADSAPLVRYDPSNRNIDTVAFLQVGHTMMTVAQDDACDWFVAPMINPMAVVDDWAVLSDGSIGIVRGSDYHIDWIDAAGLRSVSPPIPFVIKPLTSDGKVAFLDSTRAALEHLRNGAGGLSESARRQKACDPTEVANMRIFRPEMANDPSNFIGREGRAPPPLLFVSPSALPDYVPPFGLGSVNADLDDNLWIRTSAGVGDGAIYFVLDRRGGLVAHVVVPPGRVIVGLGERGAVYMAVTDKSGVRLERGWFKYP